MAEQYIRVMSTSVRLSHFTLH